MRNKMPARVFQNIIPYPTPRIRYLEPGILHPRRRGIFALLRPAS
jgi:hypothetical protein